MCPLCFSNDIGDEKHYSFHCTNPKLVEMRKRFIGLICIKRLPHFQMLTWSMYHSESEVTWYELQQNWKLFIINVSEDTTLVY